MNTKAPQQKLYDSLTEKESNDDFIKTQVKKVKCMQIKKILMFISQQCSEGLEETLVVGHIASLSALHDLFLVNQMNQI